MKKKLSALLAIVLAFCMSVPVLAATPYPTEGAPADQPSEFKIEKKYVKLDENTLAEQYPDETLKFVAKCTAAPMDTKDAPELKVDDLKVDDITKDIVVKVPAYKTPGKYNYKITEQSPSQHTPDSKDSAGVVYDKKPVYIQVVVKYDDGQLMKYVTVAANGTMVGEEKDTANDKTKKGDFKNKYLLDGEIDPEIPNPDPDPDPEGPNPIPTPDPDNPEPDPIKPIPDPNNPDAPKPSATELAKFKIMKQVRGPLASRDQKFDVTVTLTSEKPVRSDITYTGENAGKILKVGADGSIWKGNDQTGYTATLELSIKHKGTVVFSGVPAGVSYTVKENERHSGQLTADNINNPAEGYTTAYYGGGKKVSNPTTINPGNYGKGEEFCATGTVGKNKNNNIIIANSKGMNKEDEDMVKPNTGISLDSLPYMMILVLVVLGAGMMFVKSRRRRAE